MNKTGGTITIAKDANPAVSSSFQIPHWALFTGLLFPDMDAGAVTLQMSTDDTTFHPVLDPADGDDLLVVKSGSDPGFMDISDYIKALPEHVYLRVVSATVQSTAAITITWWCRG